MLAYPNIYYRTIKRSPICPLDKSGSFNTAFNYTQIV